MVYRNQDNQDEFANKNLYNDDPYEAEVFRDTFGERIQRSDDDAMDDQDLSDDDLAYDYDTEPNRTDSTFGETLNPSRDYDTQDGTTEPEQQQKPEHHDESFVDKAKEKIKEWTDNDK